MPSLRGCGRADGLEQHFFAFHDVYQSEVTGSVASAHHHRRKRGGKQKIIHLYGAAAALADLLGHPEETFRRLILDNHAVLIIGEDDRVGHALHNRSHARDGDIHVPHVLVVILSFVKANQIAIAAIHQRANLPQLRFRRAFSAVLSIRH